MSLYLGNDLISGSKPINLGVRNIGEIVASSLPLTDAGLHLLDGSLILGGGIYQGFVDYIADLYTDNPSANYFTTEAAWQQSVTAYGVCGKFVYDSVANTVRLPKVTGIIEGTTDVSALGDLVEAGLPAMTTGTAGGHNHSYTRYANLNGAYTAQYNNGCFGGTGDTTSWNGDHTHTINTGVRTTDTVQPQTIKAFYYIVIATSTKTDIQVDIDEIATDLNCKADVDLSNVTDVANIKMAHNAMPSNKYIQLTVGSSGTQYQAPADGYFTACSGNATGEDWFVLVNITTDIGCYCQCPAGWDYQRVFVPVKKNDYVKFDYGNVPVRFLKFVYTVGSESEAS